MGGFNLANLAALRNMQGGMNTQGGLPVDNSAAAAAAPPPSLGGTGSGPAVPVQGGPPVDPTRPPMPISNGPAWPVQGGPPVDPRLPVGPRYPNPIGPQVPQMPGSPASPYQNPQLMNLLALRGIMPQQQGMMSTY